MKLHIEAVIFFMTCMIFGCEKNYDDILDSVKRNNVSRVEQWIADGNNINKKVSDDWTLLAFACKEGNLDIVKILVERGADINATEGGGNSPIFWAVFYNRSDIVNYLLERNVDSCLVKNGRISARELAEKKGFYELLGVLPKCDGKSLSSKVVN